MILLSRNLDSLVLLQTLQYFVFFNVLVDFLSQKILVVRLDRDGPGNVEHPKVVSFQYLVLTIALKDDLKVHKHINVFLLIGGSSSFVNCRE